VPWGALELTDVIPEAPMAVSDEARNHLFETISRQYEPEDARTLITLLGYSTNPDELATKVDLLPLARQADLDELRREVDNLRSDIQDWKDEMRDTLVQMTRTHMTWTLGVLTAFTAMAGLLMAIVALLIS
jgi:polyhydroxyalkanoate synthesis regulator phasin